MFPVPYNLARETAVALPPTIVVCPKIAVMILVVAAPRLVAATAERGTTDIVSLLLEHGAWLKGSGAIVLAAEAGMKDVIKFLLEHGVDIDEVGVEDPTDERQTENMSSALHKAVSAGHKGAIELLVDKGANIELKDAKGRTPLGLAEESRNAEIVELLQSRSAW